MRQGRRSALAGRLGTGLLAGALVAVPSVPLVLVGASPASAAECEVGKTQYVEQPSYALQALAIPQTWRISTGQGVKVAVVDSGVDPTNAHLGDAVVLPGVSFVPGDTSQGRTDTYGHGTAVAGIIAGRAAPGTKSALYGAAPGALILPVRVFVDDVNPENTSQPAVLPPSGARTAQGIRWAADHGARVINVSISTQADNSSLVQLKAAVDYAYRKGIVVVASAGNSLSGQAVTQLLFPAGAPHVIGVAAADTSGDVTDASVHGPQVDVSAPGANILIAFHANGDCISEDTPATSWAAPFVSALAAQLVQRYPKESVDQLTYRIEASAQRPDGATRDDQEGWGLIQPYDALTMTSDPRRAGPAYPGRSDSGSTASSATGARAVSLQQDPLDAPRQQALWWLLGGVGIGGLALVLRPLLLRTLERRRAVG